MKIDDYFKDGTQQEKRQLINKFISSDYHSQLMQNVINQPKPENKQKLNKAFIKYCQEIRFIKYLATSIYFNSINYDKRERKYKVRNNPILENTNDEEPSIAEKLKDDNANLITEFFSSQEISEQITDETLLKAYNKLTSREKLIITAKYKLDMKDNEIATALMISPQAVSKTHRKALSKLKQIYLKGEGLND